MTLNLSSPCLYIQKISVLLLYDKMVLKNMSSIKNRHFISKNDLSFFQGNVVKYVCRYKLKNGIQDLEKIIHYCELEIKKLKDTK